MGPAFHIQAGLLVFLAYSCLWQEALSCPAEWTKIGKYCYGYFDSLSTWLEAEKDCMTFKGGHLASIHSKDENEKLADFLLKYMPNGHVWIGLSTDQVGWDRDWKWTDGSPAKYLPWDMLQPNNLNFNEQCSELHSVDLMLWNDNDCARRYPYVCKALA